ncbi:hypothetical protein ACHAXN_001778 [Cyclotella atomus]
MLGNKHVLSAVVKSGSLGSNEGVSYSDHTLQYVDFDCKKLFGAESTLPYATYEIEFKLKDTKKKLKFIAELTRIYKHQRIPERVQELADSLKLQGPTPSIVQRYQELDNEITEAMKAAAKRAGEKDFGYHRSDVLINAVPNEIWFLTEDGEELYEFDNEIFVAHQPIDERVYEPTGVCKVHPPNTKVVQVEVTCDAIYVAETTDEPVGPS